jgi:hypothetical protein
VGPLGIALSRVIQKPTPIGLGINIGENNIFNPDIPV